MSQNTDTTKARQQRKDRLQVLADVKTGKYTLEQIMFDPPKCVEAVPVYRILLALPWIGPMRLAIIQDELFDERINLFMPIAVMTMTHKKSLTQKVRTARVRKRWATSKG